MKVLVAESLGMCFGVRDAVDLALGDPKREELTVLGRAGAQPGGAEPPGGGRGADRCVRGCAGGERAA
jgi:hypothetical protein